MYRSAPYETPMTAGLGQGYSEGSNRGYHAAAYNEQQQIRNASHNPAALSGDDSVEAYISRTLYICKLPHDFTEVQIHGICAPFGDLRKITCYPSRQIAFAEYWDIRDAQRARNELKDVSIGGRVVEIQYSKTKDDRDKDKNTGTLYVRPLTTERNFHDPNTLQQYKDLFGRYGEVKKVNTNRKREAEKFIEYHDLRSAKAALEALNGADFNGVKLEVQFANQSSKTINKEGLPEYLPTYVPSAPRGVRKEAPTPAQSYDQIRPQQRTIPLSGEVFPSSVAPTTAGSGAGEYWRYPPIKMKWFGKEGPLVMASRQAATETSKLPHLAPQYPVSSLPNPSYNPSVPDHHHIPLPNRQ